MREKSRIRLMAAVLCLAVLCAAGGAAAEQAEDSLHDRCAQRAILFLYYWSDQDIDGMIPLCAPSWKESLSGSRFPEGELWAILKGRVPEQFKLEDSGDGEGTRTLTVRTVMDSPAGDVNQTYLDLVMVNEDNEWYVDPRSLVSPGTTPAPVTRPALPSQPPTPPVDRSPDRLLYYNPQGGTRYHADPNCLSIAEKYLPLQNTFTYSQIDEDPYASLDPCPYCGAPLRQP